MWSKNKCWKLKRKRVLRVNWMMIEEWDKKTKNGTRYWVKATGTTRELKKKGMVSDCWQKMRIQNISAWWWETTREFLKKWVIWLMMKMRILVDGENNRWIVKKGGWVDYIDTAEGNPWILKRKVVEKWERESCVRN